VSWPTKALGDICDITVGRTPSRSNPEFWGPGEPWLSIADMNQGLWITDTKEQITPVAAKAGKLVREGTVLLSFKLSIGKVAIAGRDLYTNEAIAALPVRAGQEVLPDYLLCALQSLDLSGGANRAAMGATLNKAKLQQIQVPVPPLDEQRRIAGILDRANGLSERRRRAAAKLDDLQLAIFSESFGDPIRNQKLWKTTELGELGEWRSGGTPPRAQKHYFRGDTPWYSSGELGPLFTIGSAESVSAEAFRETSLKPVPAGALMLGMYDTAAFKSSIASTNCACNQAVAFSKLDPNLVDPVYVYFVIKLASERLRQLQRGIRQKNLNLSIVRSIRIPAPPLELQTEFSNQIAAIGVQSDRMDNSAKQIRLLAGALQSRSFSGQL
jgi:type I restriction enzyme S subunit